MFYYGVSLAHISQTLSVQLEFGREMVKSQILILKLILCR